MKRGKLEAIMAIGIPGKNKSKGLRPGLRPSDQDPDPDDDGDDDRYPETDMDSDRDDAYASDEDGLEYGNEDETLEEESQEGSIDERSEHERMIAEDLVSALGIKGANIDRVCEALRAWHDIDERREREEMDDDSDNDTRDQGY